MSAETALASSLQEWRGLAETEGEAIRTLNWNLVAACQAALAELQPRITRQRDEVRTEWAQLGGTRTLRETALQKLVAELVELGQANHRLLEGVRGMLSAQMGEIDRSTLNLRRLQRSYTPAPAAAWNSFS